VEHDVTGSRTKGPIPEGKVPPALLSRLLGLARRPHPALLVGPSLGEDAAVIRLEDRTLVVTSDPITFRTKRPGTYAVHINANDIAAMGGRPTFFTLTLLLPPGTTEEEAEAVVADAVQAGDALGVVLIGGHSEVSAAVRAVVVSVTMLGRLIGERPLRTADGRPGDAIVQVGFMGVEGTAILAGEHRRTLLEVLDPALVDRAEGFLEDPGLSVVGPAGLAAARLEVHAMHDPTEGGLATGLRELAAASNAGLVVDEEKILLAPETRAVCGVLGVDPLGLISSGCLLLTVSEDQAGRALDLLGRAGHAAARIGRLTGEAGVCLLRGTQGRVRELPVFAADELARIEGGPRPG
jgi:hydrogenase maturation factor